MKIVRHAQMQKKERRVNLGQQTQICDIMRHKFISGFSDLRFIHWLD